MEEFFIEYRIDDSDTTVKARLIREDNYASVRARIVADYGEGAIINENAPNGQILLNG